MDEYSSRGDRRHSRIRNVSNLSKTFSAFLALLPVIAIYSSGIPGFNIADIILILFLAISVVFKGKKPININGKIVLMFLFCIYICTLPLLIAAVDETSPLSDVLIRTIRIIFYIISAIFLSRRYLHTETFEKTVVIVSVLAVCYILIQYTFYYVFGHFLAGYVPFLEVYQPGYEGVDYLTRFENHFFRPTSFFLEPAHCSRYLIIGLIFTLFNPKARKRSSAYALIIALGILLTTSGQGYIMCIIAFLFYVFLNPNRRISFKNMGRVLGILVFATAIVAAVYFSSDIIQNTISRLFNDSSVGAFSARMGTLFEVLDEEPLYLVFGHGYGAVPYQDAWMSGITYVLYGSGIIGLLILFAFFIKSVFSRRICSRMLAIAFFFLFFTDDAFNSYMTVIYLSAILYYTEGVREKRIVHSYRN